MGFEATLALKSETDKYIQTWGTHSEYLVWWPQPQHGVHATLPHTHPLSLAHPPQVGRHQQPPAHRPHHGWSQLDVPHLCVPLAVATTGLIWQSFHFLASLPDPLLVPLPVPLPIPMLVPLPVPAFHVHLSFFPPVHLSVLRLHPWQPDRRRLLPPPPPPPRPNETICLRGGEGGGRCNNKKSGGANRSVTG